MLKTDKCYTFIYDKYGKTESIKANISGAVLHDNSYTNKGTAFTEEERSELGLSGVVPPAVKSLDFQIKKCNEAFDEKGSDYDKYLYIRTLFDRNVTLAHALVASDIKKFMSIVYTPTVGLACQHFSTMFRQGTGLHFYPGNIDQAEDILKQFASDDIRAAVVTDNQGILGIGDQGAGGLAICLGKLMLYTQGAGIAPWHCLPISLDVGTDNETLLNDEKYLGWRHKRLTGDDYFTFVDKFVKAFKKVFPNALCQWEDFSKQNAFTLRDKYLDEMVSFNDDIQGTGSVTLAGIFAAMKVKKEALKDQVYLIHGAGAGGVGIGEQIETALVQEGLTSDEAKAKIFTLDSRGIVTTDRKIEPYKERYAKNPASMTWLKSPEDNTLINAIKNEKITVLIGTSGQPGCFTEDVVKAVYLNTERPVVFPLSNPTSKTEAVPEDIYKWTEGNALVATGSPFAPVTFNGKEYRIGQCNNVFIFPGVGLGVLASGATKVLPQFFTAAAHAASKHVTEEDLKNGTLFPPVEELKAVSLSVAKAVAASAIKEGVSGKFAFAEFDHGNDIEKVEELIENTTWSPEYLPLT